MSQSEVEIEDGIARLNREFNPWIDPLDADERDALKSFCEMVNKLENRSIVKGLLDHGEIHSTIKISDGTVVHAEIENLDEEALEAFLLTARLFRDNKERASIANIASIFDKRVSPRHILWMNFNGERSGLNELLQRCDTLPETNGEIFEIFLYGGYAHRNRRKYKEWQNKGEEFFQARKSIFLIVLINFWWTLRAMYPLVKELLEGPPASSTRRQKVGRYFSDVIVSLNLRDAPTIATGQRMSLYEPLFAELRNFLGGEIANHIRSDQICEIKLRVEGFGTRLGNQWIDRHDSGMLQLSVNWTSVEKIPGGKMIVKHSGGPAVFITQEFLRHLKPANSKEYDWDFVPEIFNVGAGANEQDKIV
jgi:hypothetical protein